MNQIRNERKEIPTDFSAIQNTMKGYHELLYVLQLKELEKIN